MSTELDLTGPLPSGRLVIEASAGTGKTYSLTALVVRHVAERDLAASELLVVTFTRAAAAELRDRIRRALVDATRALRSGAVPPEYRWMRVLLDADEAQRAEYLTRLDTAVATFDDATITTIHGFCQQALRQLGLRSGTGLHSELADNTALLVDEVCRDLVVAELLHDAAALSWPASTPVTPTKVLKDLTAAVSSLLGNPGAVAVPQPSAVRVASGDSVERLTRWVQLVNTAVDEVDRRRRARHELSYDDLVTGLCNAVTHPLDGPAVVAALTSRYHLVLVDEFQDTDPVQWRILHTAFTGDLVTVGDPKQAIYRFRGADVHAYLSATEGQPTVHQSTNHRSDADLVAATNTLLAHMELGDPRIAVAPVSPAESAPARGLTPGAPLVLRRVPDDAGIQSSKGLSSPLAQQAIIADLVRTVVDLLEHHTLTMRETAVAVHPGHIAVLVPSHATADRVMTALGRAGVPAVRTRTGSVFDTPAAAEWALLLSALERPSHAPTVRAAALGVFLHLRPVDIDPAATGSAARLAEVQQRCAQWAAQLAARPFLAWFDHVRADSEVVGTLLADGAGERDLTDIDHIAELLAAELGGGIGTSSGTSSGTTAAAARRCLDRLTAAATDADELGPQMRRIDSDAQAVQITTLHGSKGLEYPIVLLPFSWSAAPAKSLLVYNDQSGQRHIDIASGQGWNGPDVHTTQVGRKWHADVESRGDHLRLLYVGLTRAQHRTVVWWAPTPDSARSALNIALFDRDAHGEPLRTPATLTAGKNGGVKPRVPTAKPVDDADAARRLDLLARLSEGRIAVEVCPTDTPAVVWNPPAPASAPPELAVAATGGRSLVDPSWRRWSFSAITRTLDQFVVPPPPVMGGADEPSDEPSDLAGPAVGMPWVDLAGGTSFGTLVHAVLERIDPTSPTLAVDLHDAVWAQLRSDRLPVDADVLIAGLTAALHTPLGPALHGRRLADLAAGDRLAEMTFDLPLAGTRTRFSSRRIGEVLVGTLAADDPQLPYARSLAEGRFDVQLAGFLQGSIDAVLRVGTPGEPRFVVVDYKTNRLHQRGVAAPLDAYHPDLLPEAMAHHDYPLQALLYSVAVHRYLRWRMPAYDPATHLGGVAYLFLRGMVGEHTPTHAGQPYGVFSWRPAPAAIEALDRLLATGGVA